MWARHRTCGVGLSCWNLHLFTWLRCVVVVNLVALLQRRFTTENFDPAATAGHFFPVADRA